MPKVRPHHHPCTVCGAKTECPGTWVENYGKEPAVLCDEVDVKHYSTICDACHANFDQAHADAICS